MKIITKEANVRQIGIVYPEGVWEWDDTYPLGMFWWEITSGYQ